MRRDCLCSILVPMFLLAGARPAAADDRPLRAGNAAHVRPASRNARHLIDQAASRSPTVVRLMAELDATDVIVYVQFTVSPHVSTASTAFTTATREGRFLRILINVRTASWEQVEMLGHELQHALEIARAPAVVDNVGMRELYDRIGMRGRTSNQYETREAQRVQSVVRREYADGVGHARAVR